MSFEEEEAHIQQTEHRDTLRIKKQCFTVYCCSAFLYETILVGAAHPASWRLNVTNRGNIVLNATTLYFVDNDMQIYTLRAQN